MHRVSLQYSDSKPEYKWLKTRNVRVGDVLIGSDHPVRIQSMTNTPTSDTEATAEQVEKMVRAGCELVRISVPGLKDVKSLKEIREKLKRKGIRAPLIADVHFNPKVAEEAARIVEKVRINPGNYVDRASEKDLRGDNAYSQTLDKIREKLIPLVRICKQYGTAIRIGSNHGSLSERILYRYGNTPEGMVESTMEFVRIFEDLGFSNLVLAMKASAVKTMVDATQLLVRKMTEEGVAYPVHLGVTEAGDGDDGRIKSAAGIGALLYRGIGDTIRVSLAEDPVLEIPVAKKIVMPFNDLRKGEKKYHYASYEDIPSFVEKSFEYSHIKPFIVASRHDAKPGLKPDYLAQIKDGRDEWILKPYDDSRKLSLSTTPPLEKVENIACVFESQPEKDILLTGSELYEKRPETHKTATIIRRNFGNVPFDELLIRASMELGFLLSGSLAEGIWIEASNCSEEQILRLSFDLFQATGLRSYKTDYIACPSCSRTTFDLMAALEKVKRETNHLSGLKIAVMGCIVNGPGEMADADYGYLGSGKGKISLFRRNQLVKKDIPEEKALEELITLIRQSGDWKNKEHH